MSSSSSSSDRRFFFIGFLAVWNPVDNKGDETKGILRLFLLRSYFRYELKYASCSPSELSEFYVARESFGTTG